MPTANEVRDFCAKNNYRVDVASFIRHEGNNPDWQYEIANYAEETLAHSAICPRCGIESTEKWNENVFICRHCEDTDPFLGFVLFTNLRGKAYKMDFESYREILEGRC